MKKAFTLLVFLGAMASQLLAQIPNSSPIPVDFHIEAQDGFVRIMEYTGAADWGDTVIQTIIAPIEWAIGIDSLGNETDSLACDSMATDITGKIALIRRGDCEFGWKALRAQEAGAIAVIITNWVPEGQTIGGVTGGIPNMGAGALGTTVTIPVFALSMEDGNIIGDKLDAGIGVTGYLEVRQLGAPRTAYSYQTPQEAIRPLSDIGVTFINVDDANALPSVTINAEFTDPNGQVTTLSQDLANVPPLSVSKVVFDDSYTPSAVGTYNVKFSNNLTADELEQSFVITDDHTFALDNGIIVANTNGTIEPDSATFVSYSLQYDMGNVYRTGATPVVATHMSFMISNPDELYSGNPDADKFEIKLYNADPDGNGSIPYPAPFSSYNGLNENGGPVIPLASTEYILSQNDQGFELITVAFPSPVTLAANKMYLIMVQYNGGEAGTAIPPKYAFAGNDRLAGEVGSMIFTDSLHTDGWGTAYQMVARLHLDGFLNSTSTKLDDHKIAVSPNPTSTNVNLELILDHTAPEVTVNILDFTGRLVSSRNLDNVQNGRYPFDVSKLPNGTYFMSVNTPEGFRSKKFVVMH